MTSAYADGVNPGLTVREGVTPRGPSRRAFVETPTSIRVTY